MVRSLQPIKVCDDCWQSLQQSACEPWLPDLPICVCFPPVTCRSCGQRCLPPHATFLYPEYPIHLQDIGGLKLRHAVLTTVTSPYDSLHILATALAVQLIVNSPIRPLSQQTMPSACNPNTQSCQNACQFADEIRVNLPVNQLG